MKRTHACKALIAAALAWTAFCAPLRGSSLWPPHTQWTRLGLDAAPDPVSANDGVYYFDMSLLELGGPMDLGFRLSYRHNRTMAQFMFGFPGWGEWWWYPKYTCNIARIDGTNYVQMQLDGGDSVAFLEEPDGSYRLAVQSDSGFPYSASPVDLQLKGTNDWLYLHDPRDERTFMFQETNGTWRIAAVADPHGNHLTYSYEEPGNDLKPSRIEDNDGRRLEIGYLGDSIDAVTDHTGRSVEFVYELNAPDNNSNTCLRFIVDVNGHTNRFDYTWVENKWGGKANNLIAAHTLPEGNVPAMQSYTTAQAYASDAFDLPAVAAQTDAYGNRIRFQWDTNAHTLTTLWPDGGSNTFKHAGRHQGPESIVNAEGRVATYTHNERNQLTGATDTLGHGVSLTFSPDHARLLSVTNASGHALRFAYEDRTRTVTNPAALGESVTFTAPDLVGIHYPDGTVERFAYDAKGNVTSRTDRAGSVVLFAYDARGNLVSSTRADGGVTTYEYDAMARLVRRVDGDGATNRFAYDAAGRLTNRWNAAGGSYAYEYDALGRLLRRTDPLGRERTYAYDRNGNRLTRTAPDGGEVAARYDLMDRPSARTNALGGVTADTYDAMGRVARHINAAGQTNHYAYNYAGLLTNVTRAGVSVGYEYDSEGRLTAVTSGRGFRTHIGRDAQGRVTAVTNALGRVTTRSRNAAGAVTNVTDALGNSTRLTYAGGRLATVTDPTGRGLMFAYDAVGRRKSVRRPDGRTVGYGYTPAGRVAAATNAAGGVTRYDYDSAWRLERASDPLGREMAIAYDPAGRPARITDLASNDWNYVYDEVGRPVTVTNPVGGVKMRTYLPGGYPSTYTDSDTGTWSNEWNEAGQVTARHDPLGNTTRYGHDAFGRVAVISNAAGATVRYAYDLDGNPVAVTDPLGETARVAYDSIGLATGVTDRLGRRAAFEYDAAGRLVRVTGPEGREVSYEYDAAGRLESRQVGTRNWNYAYDTNGLLEGAATPLGRTVTYRRDAVGRVTNRAVIGGATVSFEYDAAGRLLGTTDAESRETRYEYDTRDRLTKVTLPGGSSASYERDALGNATRLTDLGGNEWRRTYTAMGRLASDVDPLSRTNHYARDTLGRIERVTYPDGTTLDLARNALGQVTGRVYSAGQTLSHTYDAAGRLTAADGLQAAYDAEGRITNAVVNGKDYAATWTPAGQLATVTYGGAITVTYEYDPTNGWLTAVSDDLSGTRVTFAHDADGRLTEVRRPNGVHTVYEYDVNGNRTRIAAGAIIDLQYTYDSAGRLLSETRDVPAPTIDALTSRAAAATYDGACQLTSASAAYDARGRRTSDGRHTYGWDVAGRVTDVDGVSLEYDAFGRLTARDGRHVACHPAIGLAPLVDDGGNWYVWTAGGRLLYSISQQPGNAVHHAHADRAGNVLAQTDAAGAVAETYAYTPFGVGPDAAPSATGNPFRFRGQHGVRAEGDGGEIYEVRARYYDARTGAFISKEPIWPQTDDPHALNPYQYARADTLNYTDVDGLQTKKADILGGWSDLADRENWATEKPTTEQTMARFGDVFIEYIMKGIGSHDFRAKERDDERDKKEEKQRREEERERKERAQERLLRWMARRNAPGGSGKWWIREAVACAGKKIYGADWNVAGALSGSPEAVLTPDEREVFDYIDKHDLWDFDIEQEAADLTPEQSEVFEYVDKHDLWDFDIEQEESGLTPKKRAVTVAALHLGFGLKQQFLVESLDRTQRKVGKGVEISGGAMRETTRWSKRTRLPYASLPVVPDYLGTAFRDPLGP